MPSTGLGLRSGATAAELARPTTGRGPRVRSVALGAVAVGTAVVAAFAPGAPAGTAAVDAVLRAALAAVTALLGAAAGPVALLVGAMIGTAAAAGSPLVALAGATLAVAVATTLTVRRAPLLTAAGAGALAQVALRLDVDGGLPSAPAAAAALAPVIVWGAVALDRRLRRRALRAAAVVGAVAAVAGGTAVVSALLARTALDRAVAQASEGLAAARQADTDGATMRFAEARRSFAEARATLDSWWARPAAAVPVAAQHMRSLRAIAGTGVRLAELGVDAVADANLGQLGIRDGTVPLDRIGPIEQSAGRARLGLERARRQLAAARSPWLLPPLEHRLDVQERRLRDAATSAGRVQDVLRRLPAILGADGPRRYFLAVVTPAELRGSGGMIGNYGEITAEAGRLQLARFGRTLDLNAAGDPASRTLAAPDDFVARYARYDPAMLWQNVTMSPDFPTVASVVENLYPQSGGAPVDGVIAVDPSAIAALLRVVGPIEVPPWPEPLTADNASSVLLHEQYVRLDLDTRVRFLGDTVQVLWRRLTAESTPNAGSLFSALGPLVPGKHLMLASTRPDEQRLLDDVHVSGRMGPARPDSLAVVTQSAGENKIDWFLSKDLDYRVQIDPREGTIRGRLRIVLHNDSPPSGLPDYVIGNPPGKNVPPGHNRMLLSVYTPWQLDGTRIDGAPATLARESELGRWVYSTFVVVPPKGTLTLDLELSGRPHLDSGYQFHLHRQPAVHPDDVRATVRVEQDGDDGPQVVSRRVTLDRDRTLQFDLGL